MKFTVLTAIAGLAVATAAQAQVWVEIPDAPAAAVPTPAPQLTVGLGALTSIVGGPNAAPGTADTVDTFCIYIPDPAAFSATTVGGATWDTQLFLFSYAPSGMGVTFNDDSTGLQSTLTGAFLPGPGMYAIAISRYDCDPLNAAGAEIWLDSPFGVERAPDGPGAPGPVAGWSAGTDIASYTIFLTGAFYCEQVPAPGSIALLGLGGLLAARRRR